MKRNPEFTHLVDAFIVQDAHRGVFEVTVLLATAFKVCRAYRVKLYAGDVMTMSMADVCRKASKVGAPLSKAKYGAMRRTLPEGYIYSELSDV